MIDSLLFMKRCSLLVLSCMILFWLFDVIFFISVLVCQHCFEAVSWLVFVYRTWVFLQCGTGQPFGQKRSLSLTFLSLLCCVVRGASLRGAACSLPHFLSLLCCVVRGASLRGACSLPHFLSPLCCVVLLVLLVYRTGFCCISLSFTLVRWMSA